MALIILEGPIASGKTTIAIALQNLYSPLDNVLLLEEMFLKECPLIERYYNCTEREEARILFMAIQNWIISKMMENMEKTINAIKNQKIVIMDRSIFGSTPFIIEAWMNQIITPNEKDSLLRYIETACFPIFKRAFKNVKTLFVVLTAHENTCYKRLMNRLKNPEPIDPKTDPLKVKITKEKLRNLEYYNKSYILPAWLEMWNECKIRNSKRSVILNVDETTLEKAVKTIDLHFRV
jgi:deoxyadenosine/deoxycytidine kinase